MIIVPPDVLTILNGPLPEVNNWIEITFPKSDPIRFATAPLTIDGNAYIEDLRSVSEMRRTIEQPIDRVAVSIQNVDRVIGQSFAADPDEWRTAGARIGRHFSGSGLTAVVELFRGVIQRPNVDDLQFKFDVVPDVLARGAFIAGRSLAPLCAWKFRDPNTCGYTGTEASCNHSLRSIDGCTGRKRRHRFGGFEHDYPPGQSVPGTSGNAGGIVGGCVTGDQVIRTENGLAAAAEIRPGESVFDPIIDDYFEVSSVMPIESELFLVTTRTGARVVCSRTHKLVSENNEAGTPLHRLRVNDLVSVLSADCVLYEDIIVSIEPRGTGTVYKFELAAGHHYCAGSDASALIVAHNSKSPFDL